MSVLEALGRLVVILEESALPVPRPGAFRTRKAKAPDRRFSTGQLLAERGAQTSPTTQLSSEERFANVALNVSSSLLGWVLRLLG